MSSSRWRARTSSRTPGSASWAAAGPAAPGCWGCCCTAGQLGPGPGPPASSCSRLCCAARKAVSRPAAPCSGGTAAGGGAGSDCCCCCCGGGCWAWCCWAWLALIDQAGAPAPSTSASDAMASACLLFPACVVAAAAGSSPASCMATPAGATAGADAGDAWGALAAAAGGASGSRSVGLRLLLAGSCCRAVGRGLLPRDRVTSRRMPARPKAGGRMVLSGEMSNAPDDDTAARGVLCAPAARGCQGCGCGNPYLPVSMLDRGLMGSRGGEPEDCSGSCETFSDGGRQRGSACCCSCCWCCCCHARCCCSGPAWVPGAGPAVIRVR